MAQSKSYVGDTGTIILLDCGTNISMATIVQIKVKKPDTTEVILAAVTYNTNYIKGIIDFTQKGDYLFQAYVKTSEWEGRGGTVNWKVYDSFK